MKLTFEYKKTHINVYGDCVCKWFRVMSRSRVGKIMYDARFGKYKFVLSYSIISVSEDSIQEINDKIKELRARREKRGQ